ncbi:MAG: PepSY domain-containing protein [Gemmatimonadales bacterium]
MRTNGIIAASLAGLVLAAGCKKEQGENEAAAAAKPAAAAPAAAPAFPVEAPDSVKALAKISVDSAAKLAIARVPSGAIEKAELEREKGALIWSFDIRMPGQEGISEVNVNAVTGAVWPTEHENAASEAREAREDSAHARHPAAPVRAATPTTKRP